VPKGNTIIKAGDEILTITDVKDEWKARELLQELTVKE
jgi:Trk K+ transport system NAD-binding subunit